MHLVLFSIVAMCIAGSRTQEIAIGTEYLRAHTNDSFLSSNSATYAQVPPLPAVEVIAVEANPPSEATTTTTGTTSTTAAAASKVDDDSPETAEEDTPKKYDHEHQSHHEHAATVTVDLHNVVEIIQALLKASEQRILAAVNNHSHTDAKVVAVKSYRTAAR